MRWLESITNWMDMDSPRVGHGLMTEHQEETTYLQLLYCTHIWMDGSFWIHPLVIMQYPFLSLRIVCILKYILSDMSSTIPAFFWLPLAWNTFRPPLTFSVYLSLDLKWFSYRQYIYGSWFCIHSANLCLLFGAFNLCIFKIIIDLYVHGTWGAWRSADLNICGGPWISYG